MKNLEFSFRPFLMTVDMVLLVTPVTLQFINFLLKMLHTYPHRGQTRAAHD